MTNLYFHPEVELEITESFLWYEAITQGLGDDFISELDSAYDAIVNLAVTWPIFKKVSADTYLPDFHLQLFTSSLVTKFMLLQLCTKAENRIIGRIVSFPTTNHKFDALYQQGRLMHALHFIHL